MQNENQFDLVVIGAGTGGVGVARPCAKAGWKVAIVDSLPYGGTCMLYNWGPRKMLIAVMEGVDWPGPKKYKGLQIENPSISSSAPKTQLNRHFTNTNDRALSNFLLKN